MDTTMNETIKLIKGIIVLDIIFILILLILRKLDIQMIQGIMIGSIYSILNFRLLAISVKKSVTMSPGRAQAFASVNYTLRFVLTAIVIIAAIKADYINAFGVIIPMFFPKFIIVSLAINRKI